ncbi:MAG TPA: Flp family type IVb pilin [Caulobacterales bacterium]|nr:Flp family type IVb pilin [Caulobacterales bacterium]
MRRFLSDERGATAIEYAVLASIITVTLITALATMGESVAQMLTDVAAPFSS